METAETLLSKHKWWMLYQQANGFEGVLTKLSEKDINAIMDDFNKHPAPVLMNEDNKVIINYPNDLCRIESHEKGVFVGARMTLKGFGLVYAEERDELGRFFVKSPTTKNGEWLTEEEIFEILYVDSWND
ncbi:hypothetical protein M5X17_31120 [Paenibacillus alvei]|uniref:hypothetical protein n=1 Tax=Paenibacillus alvei TaxID=44250 RepID=UPI00227E7B81|nr:hypothetical protein [Paenibacillus alvei]MCY9738145.1 hypothetical protein [Paenibacillus alvei]